MSRRTTFAGRVERVTDRAYTRAQLDRIAREDQARVEEALQALLAGCPPLRREARLRRVLRAARDHLGLTHHTATICSALATDASLAATKRGRR